MKKLYFMFIFFIFCGIYIFSDNDAREEIDFLLFLPNSSNQFADEERAFIQLDNAARHLLNTNLTPGQIIVNGYAAFAPNDIESVELSRERALFVINELQKRGISKEFFSDPAGYGAVYLWGNNTDENDRIPNRRVRIILDGEEPIPITPEIINAETETAVSYGVQETPVVPADTMNKTGFKFPWWILLLLAVFLLMLILLKEMFGKSAHKNITANKQPQISKTDITPKPVPASAAFKLNLDDEIRFRAYELYQRRNGQDDYRDQDWYDALREVSASYTARGYSVFSDGGCWWAAG